MTATPALPATPAATARSVETSPPRAHATPGRAADFAALLDGARAATAPADDAAPADPKASNAADAPDDVTADANASASAAMPPALPRAPSAAGEAGAEPTAAARTSAHCVATGELSATASDGTDTRSDGATRRTVHNADRGAATRLRDAQSETPSSLTPQVVHGDDPPRQPAATAATGRAAADATLLVAVSTPAAKSPAEASAPTLLATVAAEGTAAASTPAAAPAPLPEARLPHPLPSPAFAPALGQQVAMWVRQGVPQAMLQLNPAELGPVAVRIALDGTQAHVDFTALHAATRDALEASLPALASALRDSGLTLAGGGVFDRPREQRDDSQAGDAASGGTRASAARGATGDAADARPAPRRRGLVDLVA